MSGTNGMKLSEARKRTPPATIEHAQVLRDAAAEAISVEDIGEIMKKQLEKARAGDTRAAKFILDFAATTRGRPGRAPESLDAPKPHYSAAEHRNRLAIARLLATRAPLSIDDIADELDLPTDGVEDLVESHPWFTSNAIGIHLTTTGRKESGV